MNLNRHILPVEPKCCELQFVFIKRLLNLSFKWEN